ncbi:MAG: Cas9 inhibitor AcrIIA9 family protein, partial [Floccifex sp.]
MFKDDYEKVKNENIKKVCDYLASRNDVDKDKEGKSIDEMWKYIVRKAKEKSVNGCAVLSDDEVYGLAVHFYDEDIV